MKSHGLNSTDNAKALIRDALGTLAGQNGDWQARLAEGRLTLKVARRLRAIMANCQ